MQAKVAQHQSELPWLFLVVLISALAFRNVHGFHGEWEALIDAAVGVTEGRPHWRAFQNRLLGPYTVHGIAVLGFSLKQSVLIFTAGMLLIHNLMLYRLLHSYVSSIKSLLMICLWSYGFLVFQCDWLYVWDMIDINIFTLASFVIVFERRPTFLLFLYPVALINRESALYLPLAYIIVTVIPPIINAKNWRELPIKKTVIKVAFGTSLMIIGIFYTYYVRNHLFIESSWGGKDMGNPMLLGNQSHWLVQIQSLVFGNFSNGNIIHTVTLWIALAYVLMLLLSVRQSGILAGGVFFLSLLAGIISFGVLNETRLLFPLMSLLIFLVVANLKRKEKLNCDH